jgi:hypothetical protein
MNKPGQIISIGFTLFIFIVFKQTGFAQPSFVTGIKTIVTDNSSMYYYPTLLDKIRSQPDSMTKEDLYYLYYGQLCQPGHMRLSFQANPESAEFQRFAMNGRCKKAIPVGLTILDRSPVDLTTLLMMSGCLKGQADTVYFIDKRILLLLDAIFATGDGRTKETAIKIANCEDDLVLKEIMHFAGGTEYMDSGGNKSCSLWRKDDKSLYFEDVWAY